jgi:hypothetical protein
MAGTLFPVTSRPWSDCLDVTTHASLWVKAKERAGTWPESARKQSESRAVQIQLLLFFLIEEPGHFSKAISA